MLDSLFQSIRGRIKSNDPICNVEAVTHSSNGKPLPQQDVDRNPKWNMAVPFLGTDRCSLAKKLALKVKIKSLAAESRIIRKEVKKARPCSDEQHSLHQHKIFVVRPEARATFLAYGFLRYRDFKQVEKYPLEKEYWTNKMVDRARIIVAKYGPLANIVDEFDEWLEWACPQTG